MRIPIVQIDAFTREPFRGNPAAVCALSAWLDAPTMQAIAAENNLSETAFFVPRAEPGAYDLRWFTPTVEVELCGHATLASAHVVFTRLAPALDRVVFHTLSGALTVERDRERLVLDLPSRPPAPWDGPVAAALGMEPRAVLRATMAMAVLDDEATVRAVAPDMTLVAALDSDGLIVTAPGTDCDFVSRYFAPHAGIDEDPVTGSAHCTLTPYWAERLGRATLFARQVSARGGELWCTQAADRVRVAGYAVEVMDGTLHVPDGGMVG